MTVPMVEQACSGLVLLRHRRYLNLSTGREGRKRRRGPGLQLNTEAMTSATMSRGRTER